MFALLSGLWKYLFQKDEYCILILGLDNAGKSTLLEQIKRRYGNNYPGLPFEKITTTVGLNIAKINMSHVKLIFWDLGGQQELQSLWDKYYEECHGLVYVIDSTDETRMEESHQAFNGVVQDPHLEGIPLLILVNKQDLQGSLEVEAIKSIFNGKSPGMGHRDCYIQPTSALNGDGISTGIEWLVQSVKSNLERPPRQKDIT